jgi:hypothetical protein
MTLTFYLSILLFTWNEIYYILNKDRLDINFKNKDVMSVTKIDLIYYAVRVLYWGWIIYGMFFYTPHFYFILLFILGFLKFPIFHINRKLYFVYEFILPIISILILVLLGIS